MIGPVQLVLIGTETPEAVTAIHEQVERMRAAGTIGLLDVLCLRKNRNGTIEVHPVSDPEPDMPHEPGEFIRRLLRKAGAATTLSEPGPAGRGYLLCGGQIPDPDEALPPGVTVLALLLDHRWAAPLREAVRAADAFPVGDAWLGRQVLREVQLIGPDDE